MKPQRLRSKLHKIREAGEAAAEEGGELNIIPYLDIVVNIIMFMLATTTFAAALADINVSLPTVAAPSIVSDTPPPPPKEELNLTVSISEKGYTIAASGAVLYEGFTFDSAGNLGPSKTTNVPTIPKKSDGTYDTEALTKAMVGIKKLPTAAGETKVIIMANPQVIYADVVTAMDACRGRLTMKDDPAKPGTKIEEYEGFSDVVLSAGVN
jgi:biopolymer transport protein ExbD